MGRKMLENEKFVQIKVNREEIMKNRR